MFYIYARIATQFEINALHWEAAASWAAYASMPQNYFQNNTSIISNKEEFLAKVQDLNPQTIPKAFVFVKKQKPQENQKPKTEVFAHALAPLTYMFQEQKDHEKVTLINLVDQAKKRKGRTTIIEYNAPCLPISDHYGIIVKDRNLLTQNLLMPCQFIEDGKDKKYFNNGFKLKSESKQQFFERLKRIYNMLNPYFNDDTIALFQEIHASPDIAIDEVKEALVGGENKERFNGGLDVGIYWGKNYTPSKAHPSRWKVVAEHELASKDKDEIPQTMRSRYVQLQRDFEVINVYSFHGYFMRDDKKQENIKNTYTLILKILQVCKGERVIIGGDFNLFIPNFVEHFKIKNGEITTHNVHIYYLKDYSTISWHGKTFKNFYFNNLDCLIEAFPI